VNTDDRTPAEILRESQRKARMRRAKKTAEIRQTEKTLAAQSAFRERVRRARLESIVDSMLPFLSL